MHVDGRRVGKNTNYFSRAGLFSEIIGEDGERHVVEMRLVDTSRLQLEKYVVRVTLDGRLIAVIDQRKEWQADDQCPFCRYDLSATPTVNREVACPECGRHTAAASLGRQKSSPKEDQS